jgi:hypothetical protein
LTKGRSIIQKRYFNGQKIINRRRMILKMKKAKKVLSIILCIILVLSNFAFADNSSDLKGNWAEDQINSWLAKGYVKGFSDGSFKPNNDISRIEFVILINRAFGFTETETIDFKDVKVNDWFYSEVSKAKKAGYIAGQNGGAFNPNDKITRQEAAVILSRLFNLQATPNAEILGALNDAANIPSWSQGAISAVISKGYMQGLPDKSFKPSKIMTRAEAIVILDRCYLDHVKVAYDKAGVYTAGTVEGSLEIKAADVTLQDTVINGNLIISENVGDGNVNLKNVIVNGSTYVRGGGLNSIYAEDSSFKIIIIDKMDNKVRFVVVGKTTVSDVDMKSGGTLEEQSLIGTGFGNVLFSKETSSKEPVILIGEFQNIDVKAANIVIDLKGSASKLDVAANASNALITLSLQAKIKEIIFNALAVVTGNGSIETALVNASNSRVEVPNITANIGNGATNVYIYTPAPTRKPTRRNSTTPTVPTAAISYFEELVTGVNSTMEYSTDNWGTSTGVTGTNINISSIIPANGNLATDYTVTLNIRVKASPNLEQTLLIPARPAYPVPGDGTGNTFKVELASGANGTRVTAQSNLEVSIRRADFTTKVAWENGTPTGKDFPTAALTDSVRARIKATSTSFAGDSGSITMTSLNCKVSASTTPIIAGAATDITVWDLDVSDDATDFQVEFTAAEDETLIDEYRIMVIPSASSFSYNLNSANGVAEGKYISVPKTGVDTYTVDFADHAVDVGGHPIINDVDGKPIITGEPYAMFILSVADGVNANVNSLSPFTPTVRLIPSISIDLVPDTGNEAKFEIVGMGDYYGRTYPSGTLNLLMADGTSRGYYLSIFNSKIYYRIEYQDSTPEPGDKITLSDDGTGLITISLTDATDGSLDGYYLLGVGPYGYRTYIPFVIETDLGETDVIVVRPELELASGDNININYYHSGEDLSYSITYTAGSANLLYDDGSMLDYQTIPASDYSFKLESNVEPEADDQITVTDDGNGSVTITVSDPDINGSLDGIYTLWVSDDNFKYVMPVDFTIEGTTVTIQQ